MGCANYYDISCTGIECTFFGTEKRYPQNATLCNSVIIFDEVQAIPKKCMELFNLAVNFLTNFAESDVVLCSATQPPLKI